MYSVQKKQRERSKSGDQNIKQNIQISFFFFFGFSQKISQKNIQK